MCLPLAQSGQNSNTSFQKFLATHRRLQTRPNKTSERSGRLLCFSQARSATGYFGNRTAQLNAKVGDLYEGNDRAARSLCPHATSTSRPTTQVAAPPEKKQSRASEASRSRCRRLEILIALRKMYRNVLRAQGLLSQPSPIYVNDRKAAGQDEEGSSLSSEADDEELDKLETAIEIVAELQLTAEQLKADLRALSAVYGCFGDVFEGSSQEKEEDQIVSLVRDVASRTTDRYYTELKLLPYPSIREAQSAIDARNAKYKTAAKRAAQRNNKETVEAETRELGNRLGAAEKAVEKFVAKRIQPAVKKAVKTPVRRWAAGVRTGADYVQGVWVRLNGGGRRLDGTIAGLPAGLQMPIINKEARASATKALSVEISALEKRLQEASKAREQRLRKAGMSERARMAGQLRDMDDEVTALSKTLAVKTLQLEMEYIFAALEDEALDVAQGTEDAGFLLSRTGSSDEVALLIAEFGLLDQEQAALLEAIEAGRAALLDDDALGRLAIDVPDLRSRLGIGEAMVFSGSGWTVVKLQASLAESLDKVKEGVMFFSRGIRLLGSDMSSAGRLFSRAVLGASLKGREVQAIRRTARDILTFIPFAIILIAPISPIGHVLVFSFIQRYFPGFFPSQFTTRRQDLMMRYEELKHQLQLAKEAAHEEDEEAELARATAAVARLTAPAALNDADIRVAERLTDAARGNGRSSSQLPAGGQKDSEPEGPAAIALRNLEAQVAAAAEKTLAHGDDEP